MGSGLETPTRITAVIGSLQLGGAERSLVQLSSALAQRGYSVTILTIDPEVQDVWEVPHPVVRIRAHPDSHLSCRWHDLKCQVKRRSALRRSLLQTRPNVVVSFLDTVNISVLLAAWHEELPVVVSEQTDPRHHPIGARWRVLRWLAYPRAARVVFLSDAPLPWAKRFWPRWRTEAIPNPVFPAGHAMGVVARTSGRQHVYALGRLQEVKGFDLLIRAFASLAREFPSWDLVILGEGPQRRELSSLSEALGVADRVRMPGARKSPFSEMSCSDLFVFSSRYEGFGMALAEAMAAGMPVVSFDCPSGPGRIVRHEIDGLLVPPEDVQALADAMSRLMSDPAERARLASRAPEVTERFPPAGIFDRWDRLIRDVLKEAA